MNRVNFSIAINDDIAEKLCNFRERKEYDFKEIEEILQYYKPSPFFTYSFLERFYGKESISTILSAYTHLNFNSIEELSKHTLYKIILTQDNDEFPYVNIKKSRIYPSFCSTFLKNEDRTNARKHIRSLLEQANILYIYDRYLDQPNVSQGLFDFFEECLPKAIKVLIHQSHFDKFQKNNKEKISKLKQKNPDISFGKDTLYKGFENSHDRYLIIDQKIRIILTSGIEHLMDNTQAKDFTYIVQEIN